MREPPFHRAINPRDDTLRLPPAPFEAARAQALSEIMVMDDMRSILVSGQHLLAQMHASLTRAVRTAQDLIQFDPLLRNIEGQTLSNLRTIDGLADTDREPSARQVIELRRAIIGTQTLVAETLLSEHPGLSCEKMEERLRPGPEFENLAPILGVTHRAQRRLRATDPIDPRATDYNSLSHSLGILVAALSEGLPQSTGWRRRAHLKEARATTQGLLETYRPSEDLKNLFQRTFEYVYGESGISDTISLMEKNWPRLDHEDKAVVANYYAHALWYSFNRHINHNTAQTDRFEAPLPVVFDNTLSPSHRFKPGTDTGAIFCGSTSPYSPGAIVINNSLNNNHSAVDTLSILGHEVVHACVFHLIREGITPPGCELDIPWLKASTMLCAVSGFYDLNPHEHIASFGEKLLKNSRASRGTRR